MRSKSFVTRLKDEDGQAIVLVAVAMSIFLLAAVGLAVDGSTLYTHRQMAQAAADAAAQAGIMSIFDGTNGKGTAQFVGTPGTTFDCTTTDARTPCAYARLNGFGGSASEHVTVSFPTPSNTAAPGVALSGSDPTNLIKVSVSRDVNTTLMRLLGPTLTTVRATAMAAIVSVVAPVPILITHPTNPNAFSMNGGPKITICGGPSRSIQVNSSSSTAFSPGNNSEIDLSHAGILDTNGDCSTGTGADFGVWGPEPNPGFTFDPGTLPGRYLPKSSAVQDPLKDVLPPDPTGFPTPLSAVPSTIPSLGNGANGCPASPKKPCFLYSPGIYPTGINGNNSTPVFSPGIYYIKSGGITCHNNCSMFMATGVPADGASGTNTKWTRNVMFYNTGPVSGSFTNAGPINISADGSVSLVGSCTGDPLCLGEPKYKGILFFQDRNSVTQSHSLQGGGGLLLQGTIYLTNTLGTMADATHFQSLSLQGTPGSGTKIQGEIIVGTLSLGGNAAITMNLNATTLTVRQVALVN